MEGTEVERDAAPGASIRGPIFALMWAMGHIAHIALHGQGSFGDLTEVGVFLAAILVVLSPKSENKLLWLCAAQVIDWLSVTPFNPDHWTLALAINATLLLVATGRRLRPQVSPVGTSLEASLSSIRVLLLIAYGTAAFAKWNTTFLSPVTSCAAWIADRATFGLSESIPAADSAAVAFAVGSETAIFVLLLIPATRRFGARWGLIFHTLVSLSPAMAVSDFTATVAALFVLFLPEGELQAGLARLRRLGDDSPAVRMFRANKLAIPLWLTFCAGLIGFRSPSASLLLMWLTMTAYFSLVLLAFVPFSRRLPSPASQAPSPTLRLVPLALPAFVFLSFTAMNPYLGLRTTGAFTMFSNLQTEFAGSNHLLVPGWHPTDHQTQLVTIESSDNEKLQILADDEQALTFSTLRTLHLIENEATLVGTVAGEALEWDGNRPVETVGSPSFLERWLLSFRPVALDGVPPCGN